MREERRTVYISDDGEKKSESKEYIKQYEMLVSKVNEVQKVFDEKFSNSEWKFTVRVSTSTFWNGSALEYFARHKETDRDPDEELCCEESKIIDEIEEMFPGVSLITGHVYYWCK